MGNTTYLIAGIILIAVIIILSTGKNCLTFALRERRKRIKPLVDEYFEWVKSVLVNRNLLLKGKTAKGLNYSVNQEKYLVNFSYN